MDVKGLTCTLQKQAELLTSVGDDLAVKTMVPRFSTKVTTPCNYSCVCCIEMTFGECHLCVGVISTVYDIL